MSWLTWWKKDEKKDNQEEEKKKEKPKTASLYYLYRSNCTEVSRNTMYGNYTFTVRIFPEIVPIYLLTRQVTNRHAIYAEVTQRDIGTSIGFIPVGQSFGTITYKIPKMGIYHGNSLKFNNNSNYTYTVTQFKIIEAGTTNIWHDCSNWSDIKIIIEDLYTRVSYNSNSITLNENEQKIIDYSSSIPAITVVQEEKIQKQINRWLLINNIYKYGSNSAIVLELEGVIPLWVYDRMLPLSTKGFVNQDGTLSENETDYHVIKINDTFYKNIENSIDFGKRDDINLDNFEEFYVKYVRILYTYQEEIEENHTFQYWEDGILKDSIIEYYPRESEDIASISNVDYILTIYFNPQTENDFLDNYIKEEDGNKILVFDMRLTDLDEEIQSLTEYSFRGNLIIIDQMIRKENGNSFIIRCCSEQIQGIRVICTTGTIECSVYPDYKITNLYCINTNNLDLNDELPEVELTLSTQDYIKLTYDNLYLTNLKGSTTYPATNVNLVVDGDITSCYTELPEGVDTINAPPAPGDYLEGESSMDLSNIRELDLNRFGELDENRKFVEQEAYPFTSQKIFLTKITVTSGNGNKVEDSKMRSSNKMEDGDTVSYALTEIYTVIIMDDRIPTKVKTSDDDSTINESTIRIQLYEDDVIKEPDCMQNYVDGNTLNIKLNEDLSGKFKPDKSNLELYIVTIGMNTFNGDEESNKIEFFSNDVTQVSVYDNEGNEIKTYGIDSTSFTTHLGTLNITYTESESDSSIKPITYSSNGNVKAIGLQTKQSGIDQIDTVNSINTIVTGNTITNNRITLVNNGYIPKKMYNDILPIGETEKHYVDSEGNITSSGVARLVAINEPPKDEYLTYKSSMNLIDVKDVNISKFGTVKKSESDPNLYVLDKQNVFLSSILVYDNEVNKKVKSAGLMSRNEKVITGGLGDGEVNYVPTNVELQRDDIVNKIENKTILTINEQNCNNFLKSVTENESGTETLYTDVYLNQACSSSFQENSENMLRVDTLFLLNVYKITFNEGDSMGKLRIHYIKSNPTEEDKKDDYGYVVYVPSSPKYEVLNLYIASGTYKDNTSDLIPHPVEWREGGEDYCVFNRKEENSKIQLSINLMYKKGLTYVVDVGTACCINTLVTDEDKDYNCYLIVSGEIPQWVFKDLLPLPKSIDEQGNITSTYTKKDISGINMYVSKIGVSKTDNTDELTESEIDLRNVADLEVLDRIRRYGANYYQKVFFVNKVKVLERFEGKIDTDGVDASFQYYDGMTENASTVEFVHDWALKLPECYESCEVSGNELTVKFGEYLQIDYKDENEDMIYDCLFGKLLGNLDISMKTNSNLNLDNITTLNIYLDILKYITWLDNIMLNDTYKIRVIYNKNGFLENKEFLGSNIKQKINYCYLIHETYENTKELNRDNILIKPVSDALDQQNNIILHDYFSMSNNMEINHLKCTNVCQKSDPISNEGFPEKTEVNLLISGDVTDWVNKHFKDSDKILPIMLRNGVEKETENGEYVYECEILSSNYEETDYFKVTSINALPAPGIGIANSDPEDQCSLNLEDFINPPEP